MFKIFDADHAALSKPDSLRMTGHENGSRKGETESQRFFLPRGSAQAKCGPQPYYYFASKSGAVPTWMIDDIIRNNNRRLRTE
jgi:hypothetical protein